MPAVYRISDLCEIFDTYRSKIYSWIKSGDLKACRTPGGHYRIFSEPLFEFVEENECVRDGVELTTEKLMEKLWPEAPKKPEGEPIYTLRLQCQYCRCSMGEKKIQVDFGTDNVSHGICPDCAEKYHSDLRKS